MTTDETQLREVWADVLAQYPALTATELQRLNRFKVAYRLWPSGYDLPAARRLVFARWLALTGRIAE